MIFNEDDLYFGAETVLLSTPVEKEQIDLEFLRYLGTVQLDAPTSTVESVTDGKDIVQTPTDSDGEGQTNPGMTEEEGAVEMDNSQHYTEIEEDSTSESQVEKDDGDLGWPITLRKGVRSCRTDIKYPISHYVRYDKLGHEYRTFLSLLGEIVIPTRVEEALQDPG